jgi:hypothetical protein
MLQAQREAEMENVRLARLQNEEELKQRHSDKLQVTRTSHDLWGERE